MKKNRILAFIIALVTAMTLGIAAAPAQASVVSNPATATSVEHAFALTNPDAFVVPMATYTDYLFCGQYGGKIYNTSNSYYWIAVYSGCQNGGIPPGHWSNEWYATRDVDYFYVKSMDVCRNIDTGYRYASTASLGEYTRFRMLNDTVSIRLYCYPAGI